jgi:hypothetical protein
MVRSGIILDVVGAGLIWIALRLLCPLFGLMWTGRRGTGAPHGRSCPSRAPVAPRLRDSNRRKSRIVFSIECGTCLALPYDPGAATTT